MEELKYCRYCEQYISTIHFQKNRARCRNCRTLQATEWKKNNLQKFTQYQAIYKNKRYKSDLNFKIKAILRSRLRKAMKNDWKCGSSVEMLGCTISEFKVYIEKLWQKGMSWDNWSKSGWHIDHIVPLDKFDLSDLTELQKACHYTNMQPLWSKENCIKSNKVK